ncbi:MAG: Gfo/Idh/MocA family oxidoreductase [Kiritimatiellae bacterium]|nr:Gfo/Idh/MocA family oxidoreductase [Kiritimatiellia bacterium]MDD5522052.1 Gfo/Idh/MocA family oxidoreductase [Kiritimatiellia bacterium]
MQNRTTRRNFLKAVTAITAFNIVPRYVLGVPRRIAPNEKVNIAGIGIGGMGKSNIGNLDSENIVALCDVDLNYAAKTIQKYPKAKVYQDYREMLDKQKDIDAVVIATPDHTHAVISMAAMKAGKHVYCQKPLTRDIYEARMLAKATRETGVCTQMGIQGHSKEDFRLICEWIWDGAIGEVREVDTWCSLSYYPWGHAGWSSKFGAGRPTDKPPVPDGLKWDLWLGPAPERPYHPAYHPAVWRCWRDFGSGMMGDRGAHTLDSAVSALKLGPPVSAEATSCGLNQETHPLSAIVTYQFAARENMPPVKLMWYEGTRPPRPEELEPDRKMPKEGGLVFKGSKGKIMAGVYGESPRLIPESKMKDYKRPEKTLPRVKGTHEQDWVDAIRNNRKAGANFEYSGPLTETCIVGRMAIQADAKIEWDAANMKITNIPAANKYVRTEYRQGWSL